MLNSVPEHLKEKVENTLALLNAIRTVEPPVYLAGRIMARIHEACQPGYFPILEKEAGEEIPQLVAPELVTQGKEFHRE